MNHQPENQPSQNVLQSQALRDLKWAITSPSLITQASEDEILPEVPDFQAIDVPHLENYLAPYSRFRIGTYFEGLVLYWLEHIRRLKIIARHQQIFEANQTIGEIDILFEDEAGVVNHWEIAVKFYLYDPGDNATGSHFVGPNVKDTFEKKMRRLFDFQLPLSKTHFPEVNRRQAFVKGMIFYHTDHNSPKQLPEKLSPTHERGSWLHLSELSRLNAQHGELWFLIREKPDWLSASLCSKSDDRLLNFNELQQHMESHFQHKQRPILISALNCQESKCSEVDRVFIASESWPQI
ncbi:DUF1853 family protein [Gimesia fumaroli]|uniref:DUF1853 domain-containing protein n=1 Tax=Gimesia fumaroli TaxID=2527976 RepID=A0A518IFG1_9PLAN|nr:DUF1853 family protein [Gimesia fumaroli]QDV51833.1 hypothetical protein Enr17x_38920 [Gimesia fumaroli]